MDYDFYTLENGKVIGNYEDYEEGEKPTPISDLGTFVSEELDIGDLLRSILTKYIDVHGNPSVENEFEESVHQDIVNNLLKFFKEKKGKLTDKEIFTTFVNKMKKDYKTHASELYEVIHNFIKQKIISDTDSNNKKKANGGEMFNNLKQAKIFTAHLDSLAETIQNMEGVSEEMRLHLAYRLDRLSDLIEDSAMQKEASVNKEALGVGKGTWVHDADEARYMSTFGGTGALKQDPDEPYMKFYKDQPNLAADHKEVLERTEPASIQGAGPKAKQPSDNYNEAAVASKLRIRNVVKKAMSKLGK